MMKSLAELKRALQLGVVVTLVHRDDPPLRGGYDATGKPRRVVRVQSKGVAFESIVPGIDKPSWLHWPRAADVLFAVEETTGADLFTVSGLTYRIENSYRMEPSGPSGGAA